MCAPPPLGVPDGLADWLLAASEPVDALEHVSVHALSGGALTLGFFHVTARLRDAERCALRLSSRAVDEGPLRGYALQSCGGVLVPRYHDALIGEAAGDDPGVT
ncbi:hypothetical protein [Streptomyces collinus]|uniref:hypothetical protein n=1 Tax=Streptomyces collinus TaxID=42684 RepID=UPI0036E65D25